MVRADLRQAYNEWRCPVSNPDPMTPEQVAECRHLKGVEDPFAFVKVYGEIAGDIDRFLNDHIDDGNAVQSDWLQISRNTLRSWRDQLRTARALTQPATDEGLPAEVKVTKARDGWWNVETPTHWLSSGDGTWMRYHADTNRGMGVFRTRDDALAAARAAIAKATGDGA